MEIKDFAFEVKATDDNTFEGYAAVFRNKDSHDDVIEPGAFAKTIEDSKRVKVLWQHDPWQPIGKPLMMAEDNHGLHIKAQISQTDLGKNAMILIRDKVIDELSIGYNTIKADWDKENGVRRLTELKLWEFSPVTFASNDMANITDAKGINPFLARLNNWVNGEMKAGSMLSAKNKGLVTDAIGALQALLDAAEGKNIDEPPSNPQLTDDEQKAANDVMGILQEMQDFAKKY